LITGASTGIGAIYADRLAHRGYDLILIARDEARLQANAGVLRAQTGAAVEVIRADLTQKPDLAKVEARLQDDPAITLFINNAGVGQTGTLLDGDPDQLEALIQLNVLAMARLATAAAKNFAARREGAIINLSSVLALAPERAGAGYAASKAFVLTFSQALRRDLEPLGVRVQVVLPGATRTEIWDRSGKPVSSLPPEIVMEVDELVDAALVGFDSGEFVTLPALPDEADWAAYEAARQAMGPNLSHDRAADRYRAVHA
jgi:hypothetical protein